MKKVFLILFLISSTLIKAQAYKPIPLDTNHYWSEYFTGWQGPQVLFSCVYKYKVKDTLVQSTSYKKIINQSFSPANGSCGLNNILLRQDSVQRKVFVLVGNQEFILYNFNKVLGDTLKVCDLWSSPTMITRTVTAVDSVLLLDNKYHKRFQYLPSSIKYVIEGVGGEYGLLTPYFAPFETYRELICLSKINSTTTTVYMNSYYTQAGCTPFIMGTHVFNNSGRAQIFPNPVIDRLTITNDQNYSYKLIDVLGKNIPIPGITNNSLDLSHLPKGIYFLRICEGENLISVEKIMKE